ncbi:HAD family hydrolase [soil metagenome]
MTGAISVVLFDLDDTLFAHREAVEAGVAAYRDLLGGDIAAAEHAVEIARWNALEEEHYHRYLTGELPFLGQRRERARAFMAPFGVTLDDAEADSWFNAYVLHYEQNWSLHADTMPCLAALQDRGLRIGLITNGDIVFQTAKIDAVGLTDHLDHVIASGEVGVAKPDPAIFELAAERFNVPVAGACYVGDRLRTDALGAVAAGMLGVWLDRRGIASAEERAEASVAGVPIIHSLSELPALLA